MLCHSRPDAPLIGGAVDTLPVSSPFYYAVHKASILTVHDIESHLASCQAIALEQCRDTKPDYFGLDPCVRSARLSDSECDSVFNPRFVSAAFRTSEIAIDPEPLATVVRARLAADSRIQCRLGSFVRGAEPMADGVWIESQSAHGRARQKYDHVVNSLWEGRLTVDQTAGVKPARISRGSHLWSFRMSGTCGFGIESRSPDSVQALDFEMLPLRIITPRASPIGTATTSTPPLSVIIRWRYRFSWKEPSDWVLEREEDSHFRFRSAGVLTGRRYGLVASAYKEGSMAWSP